MKIYGKDSLKFTIKIGTLPSGFDPNHPEALRKLEDANRTGSGKIIKGDDSSAKKGKAKTSKASKKKTSNL